MYCIRLICKKVIETDEGPVFDEYVNATHIKIKDGTLYLLNPVFNNNDPDNGYVIGDFSHMIINHYQIYTIDEVIKAYQKIINAYSTLSQSASYLKDYDSVISIFELTETMYSEKIGSITLEFVEQITKLNKTETTSNAGEKTKNVNAKENDKKDEEKNNGNSNNT